MNFSLESSRLFLSNRLDQLAEALREELFAQGTTPFAKRFVIVPDFRSKSFLQLQFAGDPEMRIAAGMHVLPLSQAIGKILTLKTEGEKKFPSFIELSFMLEQELRCLPSEVCLEPLQEYLKRDSQSTKLLSLCDELSRLFLLYGLYSSVPQTGWQAWLWKRLFSPESSWTYPAIEFQKSTELRFRCHLWGFSSLPPLYLQFFKQCGSSFYFFSPCELFWEDIASDRQRIHLEKKTVCIEEREQLREYLDEANPLLANFGRFGKRWMPYLEELPSRENYCAPKSKTLLHLLQRDVLELKKSEGEIFDDRSIQCHGATSRWNEVEILLDQLSSLVVKEQFQPSDIAVFAPDISLYAPYIHTVFGSSAFDYAIHDLPRRDQSSFIQGFEALLSLSQERFTPLALFKLFSCTAFREKFSLSLEEIKVIERWIEKTNVQWGMNSRHRDTLLASDWNNKKMLERTERGTWEESFSLLIRSLTEENSLKELFFDFTQSDLLSKLITLLRSLQSDLHPLEGEYEKPLPSWMSYLKCLGQAYFSLSSQDEALLEELDHFALSMRERAQASFSFPSIRRFLDSLFGKKDSSFQSHHLNAVTFSSLGSLCCKKVICLLGMHEGNFPRKNERLSLCEREEVLKANGLSTQVEEDRYLFLQLLLNAGSHFLLIYERLTQEERCEQNPSLVVQELFSYLDKSYVSEVGKKPSECLLFHHSSPVVVQERAPLIPEFYTPAILQPKNENCTIEVRELISFAKRPIQFYLKEILKLSFPQEREDDREFAFSNLERGRLRAQALKRPIQEVLREVEHKMPLGIFGDVQEKIVRDEIEEQERSLATLELKAEDLFSTDVHLRIPLKEGKEALLTGTLDNLTPKGWLFAGGDKTEDLVKAWPGYLLYCALDKGEKSLLLLDKGEKWEKQIEDPLSLLARYIEYYQLARTTPSPLLPEWAKPLLEKDVESLERGITRLAEGRKGDEVLEWLFLRDPPPSAEILIQNWSDYLNRIFEGLT